MRYLSQETKKRWFCSFTLMLVVTRLGDDNNECYSFRMMRNKLFRRKELVFVDGLTCASLDRVSLVLLLIE